MYQNYLVKRTLLSQRKVVKGVEKMHWWSCHFIAFFLILPQCWHVILTRKVMWHASSVCECEYGVFFHVIPTRGNFHTFLLAFSCSLFFLVHKTRGIFMCHCWSGELVIEDHSILLLVMNIIIIYVCSYESLKPGIAENSAEYDKKLYCFCSEGHLEQFMRYVVQFYFSDTYS